MERTEAARIAFLITSLDVGGAEKHTLQLYNSVDGDRFRVALGYLKRNEQLLAQIDPSRAPSVWCGDFGSGWNFSGLKRLSKWLRRFDPDALVCVNAYPLVYGHIAKRLAGTRFPILEIFHTSEVEAGEDRKMRLVYRHFFNLSQRIIYVSEKQKALWEARGINAQRGVCIHNGVDIDHFRVRYATEEKLRCRAKYGFAATDFVVGICAELRPEKQHGDLLAAIARLKQDGVPAKGLIIGDGRCRNEIERTISRLALEGDAVITGFQQDVRPLIACCSCLALVSSHVEAFSLAALEAMAMEKPMVMSDIGGASEQIINGFNGYVYPRGDVRALTDALRKLTDSEVCARMGARARERVSDFFSIDVMRRRYERLFAEVVKKNHDIRISP